MIIKKYLFNYIKLRINQINLLMKINKIFLIIYKFRIKLLKNKLKLKKNLYHFWNKTNYKKKNNKDIKNKILILKLK